jgi:hypothetical protein
MMLLSASGHLAVDEEGVGLWMVLSVATRHKLGHLKTHIDTSRSTTRTSRPTAVTNDFLKERFTPTRVATADISDSYYVHPAES